MISKFHLHVGTFAILLSASCANASPVRYWQLPNGSWTDAHTPNQDHIAEAIIECSRDRQTNINIVWFSESGDWTATDTYSSYPGRFYERTIRFAQFTEVAVVKRSAPDSDAVLTIIDSEGRPTVDPGVLPELEVETFSPSTGFPFPLPQCARRAFDSSMPP